MGTQRKPPDGTELGASKRDLLFAVAGAMEGPGTPTVAEVRQIAVRSSERFPEGSTGNFYNQLGELEDTGLLTTDDHAEDARTQVVGFTVDGEAVLDDLYDRAQEAVAEEADG